MWLRVVTVVTGDSKEEVIMFRDKQTERHFTETHHNMYSTTFFHLCHRQTVGAVARDGTQFCLCGCKPHSWNGIMIMMMITMMMIAIMETEKLRKMIKMIEAMKLTKTL